VLEVAKLLCADINQQIEEANWAERHGYHRACLYRCRTAVHFCESLIAQLDKIIEKESNNEEGTG